MPTFRRLDGVSDETLEGPYVSSITAALKALRSNRICSAAGTYGSVTVWIDDDGKYRCAFHQYLVKKAGRIVSTKKQVRGWLKEWLPQCYIP